MSDAATRGEERTRQYLEGSAGTPEGRRMIRLLWDPPGPATRGRKQRISLVEVVGGAIALADADGFEALTMRGLAKHLGVGAMSLYTYVPGKAELFELMIDRAYADRALPDAGLTWRARYEAHVREALAMYRRHPWLLESNLWRLPIGPHVLDISENLLVVGRTAGLSAAHAVRLATLLESYAFGIARGEIADRCEARRTGERVDEYWTARSDFWTTYFDPARYPQLLCTWETGAYDGEADPEPDLAFALGLILDSVERLVAGQAGAAGLGSPGEAIVTPAAT